MKIYSAKFSGDGFILIEVLLSTVIASMVSVLLLSSLSQTNKFRVIVDNFANMYGRAALVQQQLSGDISSIFIPAQAEPETEKSTEAQALTKLAQAGQSQPVPEEKKETEKKKLLEKVFYATQKDGKFELLTFITTNSMQTHWGTVIGKAKPRMVRVVYRFIPDKKIPNSYILTRQEGSELDLNLYKEGTPNAPRSYEMIDGIKEITIEYTAPLKVEEPKERQELQDREKKREYKTFKEWDYAKIQEQDKRLPKIPTLVHIRLVLWDSVYKKSTVFVFTPAIVSDVEKEKEQKKPEQPKTPESRSAGQPAQASLQKKKLPAPRSSSTLKMTSLTIKGQ